MAQVYKLPSGINLEVMRSLTGTEGSKLNPIEDANGNWVISIEEYNASEFQWLVNQYPEVYSAMMLIDYAPIPMPELLTQ